MGLIGYLRYLLQNKEPFASRKSEIDTYIEHEHRKMNVDNIMENERKEFLHGS